MSKELDELAKQYAKDKPTVMQKELSLYRTTMSNASASFLHEVEHQCKKLKQANLFLIVVIPEIK
jgi:hypothetical protein